MNNRLGRKLKSWRLSRGLTQEEAAAKAGITQANWSLYENGKKVPGIRIAKRIVELTKRSPHRVTIEMVAAAA